MNPCDVAIFMGRCEKALFQATFGHKTRTLILIASVSKLAFLYGGEEGFEPSRGLLLLSVFETDPFSQAWVFLQRKYYIKKKLNEIDISQIKALNVYIMYNIHEQFYEGYY